MPKSLLLTSLLLFMFTGLLAQKTVSYKLPLAEQKITGSKYSKFTYLDSRPDTTSLGVVQTGMLNRKAKVIAAQPLGNQFGNVFNSLIDNQAKNGHLLLLMRQFTFAEVTKGFSETGYCYIRAELYAAQPEGYRRINRLDTVMAIHAGMDVTQALLDTGGKALTGFLVASLLREPATADYLTYNDLTHIDNYEKRQIKIYNTETYVDGLYANYQSFKNQVPDKQVTVDGPYLFADFVKTPDAKGKLQKVKPNKFYALVYKGQPYIVSNGEYYPVKKVNDELQFIGTAKVDPGTVTSVMTGMLFGMLGSLMLANDDSTFEMQIDHINGGFIRLKEIVAPPTPVYQE